MTCGPILSPATPLGNTLIFVTASVSCEMILGLLIALIINRSFRGRGLFRAAVLIPWAIPTVVASQMWRFINNDYYGLLNYILFGSTLAAYRAWLADPLFAMGAMIAADVWKTSAFAALILLAGLQTIPEELYEAARMDGATAWQRFTRITLPLLMPAFLIALLFRTMDAFRVFDLVFVMTQGGPADSTDVLQFYGYKKMFAEGFLGIRRGHIDHGFPDCIRSVPSIRALYRQGRPERGPVRRKENGLAVADYFRRGCSPGRLVQPAAFPLVCRDLSEDAESR